MKLLLKDQSGLTWTCFPDDDYDVIEYAVKQARTVGYTPSFFVLPDELPRTGTVDKPDWEPVIALFRASGDTPEWRDLVRVNELRKAVHDHP